MANRHCGIDIQAGRIHPKADGGARENQPREESRDGRL